MKGCIIQFVSTHYLHRMMLQVNERTEQIIQRIRQPNNGDSLHKYVPHNTGERLNKYAEQMVCIAKFNKKVTSTAVCSSRICIVIHTRHTLQRHQRLRTIMKWEDERAKECTFNPQIDPHSMEMVQRNPAYQDVSSSEGYVVSPSKQFQRISNKEC